jgi:hypothetical protein
MTAARAQAGTTFKAVSLITSLSALPLMVGLTGCAGDRYSPSAGHSVDAKPTEARGYSQCTDQSIENSRTAERVREALAAAPEYKFNGVQVTAGKGVVQLKGFVNTSAQKNRAVQITSKVAGVKSVKNILAVKD